MPVLSEIEDPVLEAVVRIWAAAAKGDSLPRKSDLDLVDLGRSGAMPHAWLLERIGGEMIVRLAGEEIINAMGRPVRGRKLMDVYDPRSAQLICDQWDRVLDRRETCHDKGVIVASMGNNYQGERVALPVADDEGQARFVLGATLYRALHGLFPSAEVANHVEAEAAVYTSYGTVIKSCET